MSLMPAGAPRLNNDQKALEQLRASVSPRDAAQIRQSADEFESLFLNIVLKSMRDTVQKSGLIDGGNAEEIYKGMLDDEYSKMMASQRHTGLADNIESFLLKAVGNSKRTDEMPGTTEKLMALKAYQAQARAEATSERSAQALRSGVNSAKIGDGPLSVPAAVPP